MGREYVFSAHILSLSTGPLSNPAGLAFDHLLRCFCFNRSTFFFPKVNEKLIDIIIGFFESALCTSFVALPSILNCNKKKRPEPPSGIVAFQQRPGKEPEPHKAYIPQGMAHPQSPMACTKKCSTACSPYPLTPPPPPFSLSANTFSMLTDALRSVSSLRCV